MKMVTARQRTRGTSTRKTTEMYYDGGQNSARNTTEIYYYGKVKVMCGESECEETGW